MITLTGQREIAKCNVYRDDNDPLMCYIMPQSPRIAIDDDGKINFSLTRFRRNLDNLTEEERKTRLGGGILTLSAELSATDEQMAEIRKTLSEDPLLQRKLNRPRYRNWWQNEINRDPKKLADAIKIGTVPITDGSVTIAILAETPETSATNEFVMNLVGAGKVSMTGRQRASFMAKLTMDGSILLWEMLENNLPAIRIAYELKFNHRLDAVTMTVWCNAKKSYDAFQEQWQELKDSAHFSEKHTSNKSTYSYGHDESSSARNIVNEVATASEAVRIDIIEGTGDDVVSQDQIEELMRSGNDMVKDFLASTFLQFELGDNTQFDEQPDLQTELPKYSGGSGGEREYGYHNISYYNLNEWHESMSANLNYRFNHKAVMSSTLAPNDNLSNILQGRSVEELRTEVDLADDFFNYIDVNVVCTADFDTEPFDLITAKLDYSANGPQGNITKSNTLKFDSDNGSGHFATFLASPDARSYDYECEVFYKGSDAKFSFSDKSDKDVLVLDTDTLGVLSVNVQAGNIDWAKIRNVLVKMWYGSGSNKKEIEFSLTSNSDNFLWTQVIGKPVNESYHYQVTFVDIDDQTIVREEESSTSKTVLINQPLIDEMEITILPVGNFKPEGFISHVVAALKYSDDDNNYKQEDTFTLSGPNDTKTWTVPLINPEHREFEYMEKTVFTDGLMREAPWQTTSDTIITVGDKFDFRLQIIPRLLSGRNFAFGTIHLTFHDAIENMHTEKTMEISDFTKNLFWRFRLSDPNVHTYKYQLTLFTLEGNQVVLPEQEGSQEILVLKPPAE